MVSCVSEESHATLLVSSQEIEKWQITKMRIVVNSPNDLQFLKMYLTLAIEIVTKSKKTSD